MPDSNKMNIENPSYSLPGPAYKGNMDHILEVLASYSHPFILVGSSAQRWMGSAGTMMSGCDMLVLNDEVKSIAADLVKTGHWDFFDPGPHDPVKIPPLTECDADLVLQRTNIEQESGYEYLSLWSETTYHIKVDECPTVEVPDTYPWQNILVEEKWHPALDREDEWWFGPLLHPDTKVTNLPERARAPTILFKGLTRGKSLSNNHPILVPTLPTYLDALIYHKTQYRHSNPGLASIASIASWQIRNLTRYLYLELPHQQMPLLIELEAYEYMENYLRNFKRKPFFVYQTTPGTPFEATPVKEWDPTSYPDWSQARRCVHHAPREA